MKQYYPASSLLISIMILSVIFATIFMAKDHFFHQEKISLHYYQGYLNDRFKLINLLKIDENQVCEKQQNPQIKFQLNSFNYSFQCQFVSLFNPHISHTKKDINYTHLSEVLDLNYRGLNIIEISSLDELPDSSESYPQVVIAKNAIEGKLEKNFYGIIITEYPFELSYGKQVVGILYTAYPNKSNRYIRYQRAVIEKLMATYSHWQYQSSSRNLLAK